MKTWNDNKANILKKGLTWTEARKMILSRIKWEK